MSESSSAKETTASTVAGSTPMASSWLSRPFRHLTLTYSGPDLVVVALIAGLVSVWAALADGAFSFRLLLAAEALVFTFYLTGSLFAAWTSLSSGLLVDLPLRLLVGYGVVNSALLVLAWLSPFGMVCNLGLVFAPAVVVLAMANRRREAPVHHAAPWAIGIAALASTVWCQDSLDPIVEHGPVTVFKPWVDGFYHAVHVRMFAESHGASTIEDFRMAGAPARLYHYGVYMLPAFVKAASGVHAYSVFAGVLAPLGVFFTGLAAYAFVGSLWGAWPGVAACAALLLLPDGAEQGMRNTFMSYHWLTQISPSATFGLALLAVAWLLVIRGCSQGSRHQLVAGWLVAGVLVAYKLHYVVASALPLALVPALFFRARIALVKRALWVLSACLAYAVAMGVGQKVPGVPLIRFDGSAVGEILRLVQTFARPGPLEDAWSARMGAEVSWANNLLLGIPYVLTAVFGLGVPLYVALGVVLRKRVSHLQLSFPPLLVANFLAMFFGLALDFDSSTPDELSHRPLMIVYFFVVSWIGGGVGLLLVEARPLTRLARPAIVVGAACLFVVPVSFGPGVQRMWAMPNISPVRLPTGLIRVAEHIRTHGDRADLVQDSRFDRIYALSALSERRSFVSHTLTHMRFQAEMLAKRSAAVDRLMTLQQPKLIVATAQVFGVRWFALHRGNPVRWPPEIKDAPALEAGPVALYEF